MLNDHGIDDLDDGLAVALGQAFQRLKASVEPAAAELGVIQRIAGEQIVDAGAEGVGELDEHLGRRGDESALVFVEQLVAGADRGG